MEGTSETAGGLKAEIERLRQEHLAVRDLLAALAGGEGLQPVLQEIVEAARRLCEGDYAQLFLRDGELFYAHAEAGGQPEALEYARAHPHAVDRTTSVGRVALSGDVVQIEDVLADREYSSGDQTIVGFRALLGVPIILEGALIGALSVGRNKPGLFLHEQVELVRTFADEAAIAIANAHLLETVERQLEQQRAISDVLRAVARSEGLDAVFDVVVEAATRLCRGDYGALYLLEGDVLQVVTHLTQHHGQPELYGYEREHPHAIDRTSVIGRAALTRDVVHIPDRRADPEYSFGGAEVIETGALLGAPILVDGELIGAMNVVRAAAEPFADEHIQLMKTFADQAAIAIANARLIDAVERQRTELSRFLSPQVAELVSSPEGEQLLAGHRAYITCLFCDLRGFTAFSETAAPEELFEVLRAYHETLGEVIATNRGTLEHFAGDGVMVFFNDPVTVENHELQAIKLGLAAQERIGELAQTWHKRGIQLGLGIGIEAGYATLGRIGFEGRYDYGALGPVTNLASRLSSHAHVGQTLIGPRVYGAVEEAIDAVPVGELELKGFGRPIPAYEVRTLRG